MVTETKQIKPKQYYSNEPFDPCGRICVVTGGSSGIGAALCLALAQAGASAVIVSDLHENVEFQKSLMRQGAKQCLFVRANAAIESDIVALINQVENNVGPIDLFIANAGVVSSDHGEEMTGKTNLEGIFPQQQEWDKVMGVNLNQSTFVAKHLIPRYLNRPALFKSSKRSFNDYIKCSRITDANRIYYVYNIKGGSSLVSRMVICHVWIKRHKCELSLSAICTDQYDSCQRPQ